MPLTPPIIIPLQREARGAISKVHWTYGTVLFEYEVTSPNPTIIHVQRETRGAISERIAFMGLTTSPHPTNRFPFSEKHEVPSLKCIGFTELLPPLINICHSRLSRNER